MAVLHSLDIPLEKEFNDFPNCVIKGQFIFFYRFEPNTERGLDV